MARNLLILLLFAGCAASIPPPDEIQRISEVRGRWEEDWNLKRLDDIMLLYEDDAAFIRPAAERTRGRAAIRSLFTNVLAANTPHIRLHPITTESSGNLGYESGTYDETIVSSGAARATHGDYLFIVKRQSDGRWLIAQQAWSDTGPPHSP